MTTKTRRSISIAAAAALVVWSAVLAASTYDTSTYIHGGRVSGIIPSEYVEIGTPQGTTSATLEDVTNATVDITIKSTSHIAVLTSFELATQSGASASTLTLAVSINGTDEEEISRYLSGTNDTGIGALVHRTDSPLGPGTYTVKMRMKRSAGVSTPGINRLDLLVVALRAG